SLTGTPAASTCALYCTSVRTVPSGSGRPAFMASTAAWLLAYSSRYCLTSWRSTIRYCTWSFQLAGYWILSGPAVPGDERASAATAPRARGRSKRFMGPPCKRWMGARNTTAVVTVPRRLLAPRGDLDPRQRPRQRAHRARVVDLFLAGGAAGQPALGTVAGALGPRAVDIGRGLGDVGQDDDL